MIIQTRWGNYEVVRELPGYKIKILTVNPGCGISYQKHFKRKEHWHVIEGKLRFAFSVYDDGPPHFMTLDCKHNKFILLNEEDWHQFWNFSDKPAKILEIQIGECEEEDIERTQYEWIGESNE